MPPSDNAKVRFYRPRGVLSGFDARHPDPDVPELVHAGEQWLPMHYPIGIHSHEVFELYFQINGVSTWQSGRKRYELRSKHFFLAPPKVEHALVNRQTSKHHFFFAAIDLRRVIARLPEIGAQFESGICRVVAPAESLEAPFRQLMREVTTRSPYHAQGLRAALDVLVIEAARLLAAGPRETLAIFHPGVMAVKDALDQRPEERWPIQALSKLANLSPNHLTALFVRDVGISPHRYLLGERIRLAKEMLRGTDTPITELALEIGFSSSQHFAKMFRQVTGTSALQYRQGKTRSRSPQRST